MDPSPFPLTGYPRLVVKQVHEMAELFGFETRNKYEIVDEQNAPVGFAAEQQKGFFGFLFRQFLGHWRSLEFQIFNTSRQRVMTARQPFRLLFQRLEIFDADSGRCLGAIQQRFAILTKRFDVQNAQGMTIMEVASPLLRLWTFPFMSNGREVARIEKKWSGILTEAFTDKDTFLVSFSDPALSQEERQLMLCAALFIDLRYFETKAGRS